MTLETGKTPTEVLELYCQYGRLDNRYLVYGAPFTTLAVGSIGIAIKIATGDEALAALYANKFMAGLHIAGLAASAPGFNRAMFIQDHEMANLARQIAEQEERPIGEDNWQSLANEKNRIHEVLRLAENVSPGAINLFFNRIHFSMEDFFRRVLHSPSYFMDEESSRRQTEDLRGASAKYAVTVFTGSASKEEISRKALEIGRYRWEKVAWDLRQSFEQRRYAHQMVNRLGKEFN